MPDGLTPERERERLIQTCSFLPKGRTCLEIGFSGFQMTSELSQRYDVVSVDLPREFVGSSTAKLAFADIRNLPFRDRSFDVVVCTEVLEHLSPQTLDDGADELARVTSGYLLVSVPYRQKIWNEPFKCDHCKLVMNAMEHLHWFDEERVRKTFSSMQLTRLGLIGEIETYAPDILYWISSRIGNAWQRHEARCPRCMSETPLQTPNLIGEMSQRIIWRWERLLPSRPAWMLALFAKCQ